MSLSAGRWLLLAAALAGCPHARTGVSDGGTEGDGGDGGRSSDGGADGGGGDAGNVCLAPLSGAGTAFALSLDSPRRLAVTASTVYVVVSGSLGQPDGLVLAVPRVGGSGTPVATALTAPDAIAADPAGVYVVDQDAVWRLEADGGRAPVDATPGNAVFGTTDLALSPTTLVYATGLRRVIAIPRDGGAGTPLYAGAGGETVPAVAIDGQTAYFLVSNAAQPGLYAAPLDGSSPAQRIHPGPADGRSLSVEPDAFLWTQAGGGDGGVVWLPRDGGPAAVLASGLNGPAYPVRLGSTVYFSEATGGAASASFLQAVSLCLGTGARPVGPVGVGPGDLGTDGAALYFTSVQAGQQGFAARLP